MQAGLTKQEGYPSERSTMRSVEGREGWWYPETVDNIMVKEEWGSELATRLVCRGFNANARDMQLAELVHAGDM